MRFETCFAKILVSLRETDIKIKSPEIQHIEKAYFRYSPNNCLAKPIEIRVFTNFSQNCDFINVVISNRFLNFAVSNISLSIRDRYTDTGQY